MIDMERMTLATAIAQGKLGEFVEQAEVEGIGPANRAQFDSLLGAITATRQEGQTSRSRARDSKRGK